MKNTKWWSVVLRKPRNEVPPSTSACLLRAKSRHKGASVTSATFHRVHQKLDGSELGQVE